ncbi:MAG: hypothetical protein ABS938_18480 [Psychrobacillus psychrodurans]
MENAMIALLGVGLGIGVATLPEIFGNLPSWMSVLTSNGIVAGSITAIVLNILFNMIGTKREDKMHAME